MRSSESLRDKASPIKAEPLVSRTITRQILMIRNHKVLLDNELAELYGVPNKVPVQAVKRNAERFHVPAG